MRATKNIKKTFEGIMVIGSLVSLSGCSASMQSHIQSFSAANGITKMDRIFVAWLPSSRHQQLEGESWVSFAKTQIEQKGYQVVDNIKSSSVVLFVALDVDNGRTQSYSYSIPQYGVVGYSGASTTGTENTFGNITTYNSNTTYTPQYGVTGYNSGIGYSTVFNRTGAIIAFRPVPGGKPEMVYNTRLLSAGSCGILPAISESLVKAMFSTFPRTGTDVITSSINGKC
ncbi:hypothetical protein [Acetobacter cerevisiae]|uniref:hypothetical protein n=1 Tax=Acetobacter cerevisiae TaxID=178900 RepID=UPI000A75D3ED|nr:hypothetical protein [Acetobacter cerevisiae]